MPSRSRGISPSTAVRSSASHSVVCGRHGPVRYGWSSSSGRVDRNLPTISTFMSRTSCGADNETDGGGGAATEIERAESFCVLDLIIASGPADLFGRVQQHPHAGGPDRVPAAAHPAARIDRHPAADPDLAGFY